MRAMAHNPRFEKLCSQARAQIEEISVAETAERLARGDHFELVDVREESEFAAGHIERSRHLGRGVLERDIEAAIPDMDADIVLYCGGGFRSALAAVSLKSMGYANVKSMAGGWRAWNDKPHPV
jgi:rhodanese-related sulfurtransferase